MSYSFIESLVY